MFIYILPYFLVILIGFFCLLSLKISRNFLNPFSILFYAVILESTLPIIYMINSGGYNRIVGANYGIESHFIYCIMMVIFFASFYISLRMFKTPHSILHLFVNKISNVELLSPRTEKLILIMSVLVIAPGVYSLLNIMLSVGLDVYFANRIILFSGLGFVLATFKVSQLTGLIVVANQLYGKFYLQRRLTYSTFLASLIVAVVPAILMGSRSQIFIPLVGVVTIILMIRFKGYLRFSKLVKPAVFGFLMLSFAINLGAVREAIMANKIDNIDSVESKSVINGLAFTYGSSENLLWLIENEKPEEYLYGHTYLATILGFVPRALWHDKPLGGGPVMQNLIVSGSYDQGSENISSTTTGIFAELYLNFGVVGMAIGPFLFILLLIGIFKVVFLFDGVIFVALYAAVIFRAFGYVNAEFFGVTSHIVTLIVSAFLIKVFVIFFNGKVKF